MRKMLREHRKTGKKIRGCSTISQQTAKNVFTFASGKAPMVWVRKAVEAYYTFLIEKVWGKERIMEVYLNVIEYGKGVYGIGAASEKYFGKKPSQLTRTECCRLAAVLPAPLHRNPADPGPYVIRRTAQVSSLIDKIAYPEWVGAKE
jgi:monofunctional biosynthetic peptidoglycan transglycosylase